MIILREPQIPKKLNTSAAEVWVIPLLAGLHCHFDIIIYDWLPMFPLEITLIIDSILLLELQKIYGAGSQDSLVDWKIQSKATSKAHNFSMTGFTYD